jgi:hypothetical protein
MPGRANILAGGFRHLHRFAAERVRMSTASRAAQLIPVVDVTVPAPVLSHLSADVDARRAGVYSQASGGRSLRGGLPAAAFL